MTIATKARISTTETEWMNIPDFDKNLISIFIKNLEEYVSRKHTSEVDTIAYKFKDEILIYIFEKGQYDRNDLFECIGSLLKDLAEDMNKLKTYIQAINTMPDWSEEEIKDRQNRVDYKMAKAQLEIFYGLSNHSEYSFKKGMRKLYDLSKVALETYTENEENGVKNNNLIYSSSGDKTYLEDNSENSYLVFCETLQKNINRFNKKEKDLVECYDWFNVGISNQTKVFNDYMSHTKKCVFNKIMEGVDI